jgi:hypothetical protein
VAVACGSEALQTIVEKVGGLEEEAWAVLAQVEKERSDMEFEELELALSLGLARALDRTMLLR